MHHNVFPSTIPGSHWVPLVAVMYDNNYQTADWMLQSEPDGKNLHHFITLMEHRGKAEPERICCHSKLCSKRLDLLSLFGAEQNVTDYQQQPKKYTYKCTSKMQ